MGTPAGAGGKVAAVSWTPLRPEETTRIERRLLGIMLERPETIAVVDPILGSEPTAWTRFGHAAIYGAIKSLGLAADVPMVLGRLSDEIRRALERPAEYMAQCQDIAFGFTTKAQAENQARLLRSSQHLRKALRGCQLIAGAVEAGDDAAPILAALASDLDLARADDRRIVPVSQAELSALDLLPPDSILGNGILSIGDWGLIHAREGVGKTWAILELAACLASGRPWFGIPVSKRFRVAICSLEMGRYHARQRLATVLDAFDFDEEARMTIESSILWITKDECPVLDICNPANQAWLVDWCTGHGVEVLILDPLSQFFFGDENSREGVAQLLRFLQSFPSRANGCTPIVSHHDRKQGQQGDQGDNASAARGSVAVMGSARSSFRLVRKGEEPNSPIVLICDKSNNAPRPAEIWLRQDEETGRLLLGKNLSKKADRLREDILECLAEGDAFPEDLAARLHKGDRTIETRLRELEADDLAYPKRVKPEGSKRYRNLWTAINSAQSQNGANSSAAPFDNGDNSYADDEMPF